MLNKRKNNVIYIELASSSWSSDWTWTSWFVLEVMMHHTRRRKTHHELNNVQLPDAAKHSFSLKLAVHIIAADVGLLSTILVHKRDHGS
jgi:hypothetical protein